MEGLSTMRKYQKSQIRAYNKEKVAKLSTKRR
jgi:hypothetical protein